MMTSYEYEVICKNALIKFLAETYNESLTIKDLHLVWFSKTLQNYKCVIIDLNENQRYYECTYNGDKKEIYLDVYNKEYNVVINSSDFNSEVII